MKRLCAIIPLALVISILLSVISNEESIQYSDVINDQFDQLMDFWKGEYPDYYGGAYIDGRSFTILVTCDPQRVEEQIWDITGNHKIIIKQVNNSYSFLERVRDALQHSIQQNVLVKSKTMNIYAGFGIDERNNNVILEVLRSETAKAFSVQSESLLQDSKTSQSIKSEILAELSSEVSGLFTEENINIVIKDDLYTEKHLQQ